MVKPDIKQFRKLAKTGNIVPVYAQLASDFETPLSAYLKIRDGKNAFLFESAESTDASGRWSILGSAPRFIFTAKEDNWDIQRYYPKTELKKGNSEPLKALEQEMQAYSPAPLPELPPFTGGAIGYLAYDAVRQFEPTVGDAPEDDLGLPDALFMLAGEVILFDHKLRRTIVIANAFLNEHATPEDAYEGAKARIRKLLEMLERPLHIPSLDGFAEVNPLEARSNTTQSYYEEMVTSAKEYIAAGDIFQVVPSQRFEANFSGTPADLYRALRHVNPSPYMFILELGEFSLVGSSPEVHVRCLEGKLDIRPIAGTRWRGKTPEEDEALAQELLNDKKECAEHVMLVDLARNDLGRIATAGSVVVDDFMIIERYSHVMHIVSNVTAQLAPGKSSYDVLRATFPAGTVSGAPKIRAMQIINKMECNKRCSYAGAVGYFGFDGNHDSCIALRTVLLKDGKAYIQAGAGVVADSDPTYEYNETKNKAAAMLRAIALAETLKGNTI